MSYPILLICWLVALVGVGAGFKAVRDIPGEEPRMIPGEWYLEDGRWKFEPDESIRVDPGERVTLPPRPSWTP